MQLLSVNRHLIRYGKNLIAFICLLILGCGGGGGGSTNSTPASPPQVTSVVALPAPIATGITFLPSSYTSSNQLRASSVSVGSNLFFTDTSNSPLKSLSLNSFGITALASKIGTPENLVVNGQYIYWVDGGRLNKTSISGAVTTVLQNGTRDPVAGSTADIVVDGTYAYWVNTVSSTSCSPSCTWTILRVPIAGGTPSQLASTNSEIVALASDANNIYWEERGIGPVTTGCQCGSTIKAVPKIGGTVVTLVDGLLNGLTSGSWIPTGGIAVSGSAIFFADSTSTSYQMLEIPNTGGTVSILATVPTNIGNAQNAIRSITAGSANVYWLDSGNSVLDSVPIVGGSVTTLANGLNGPTDLAINASTAYWVESGASSGCCLQMGAGQIRQVSLAGGTASTLVSGIDAPSALSTDTSNVYWTELWRIADAPITGGLPTTLASGISSDMARIAADQVNIYILDGDLVKKLPINGGTVEKLSAAHGGSIGDLSVINQDIVTDGVNVYWTVGSVGPTPPIVQKIVVGGGSPATLSTDTSIVNPQDCYWRVAVDTQNVYWSTGSSSFPVGCSIKKVPIAGGSTTTIVDAAYLRDFTVDGTNIYFSEFSTSIPTLKKISVNGGSTSTVASNVTPWVLANDNANVYWIDPTQTLPSGIGEISKSGGTATFLVQKILETNPSLAAEAIIAGASGVYWTEAVGGKIYTPIAASTLTFPLLTGLKAFEISGESRTFTVSSGCSGTGTLSSVPATTPSTFEGVSGYSAVTSISWSLTNCTPATYTDTSIDYYDSNYIPLGYDDTAGGGSYAVFNTTPNIPASVTVGNAGSIGTRTLYTSSTKATVNGKEVVSYVVEADTANSAIIDLITKSYNPAGALTATTQDRYRITASGAITRLSEDNQQSNGSTLHLVLTFN
ncbi:hypothetical protein GALL_183980 [mine drainage metagenome]|uniref:DUF5050 domain-containing protein n=1 Tax=mine drainage metagenome TaxID=410659 RepID=A0A1J5SH21_9ZZZZ